MTTNLGLLSVSLAYLGLLFGIAYYADWRRAKGRSLINNPSIYALSMAVYCTGWTFYGSVGKAASDGFMFLPIYLGPTLFAFLWIPVLRKIIRISKRYSLTSIADFISSRYGKDPFLGGVVASVAVLGILPYISLQLKAIGTSFQLIVHPSEDLLTDTLPVFPFLQEETLYITLILIVFTILFGVRRLDATERHEGMVAAVAFESLVKLFAFLMVGFFVVYGMYDGMGDLFSNAAKIPELSELWNFNSKPGAYEEWLLLGLLAMLAFLMLPRQFQVSVVENVDEEHVNRAVWLFPFYMFLINLFVLPIALAGRLYFVDTPVDADTFVLTLPLAAGNTTLAWFVFVGGLSATTSMIVVETVALSTMLSNSLIMPLLINTGIVNAGASTAVDRLLLNIRRGSVALILFASYFYFQKVIGTHSLVSIGLVSFLAVAQFAPALLGGIYWKNGTRLGALTGILVGWSVWGYTLPFSQLIDTGLFSTSIMSEGLFNISWLRPHQLFGLETMTPVAQATFWSLVLNIGCYIGVSLFTRQSALERGQANLFVDESRYSSDLQRQYLWRGTATSEELHGLLQRFLGEPRTNRVFQEFAQQKGINPDEVWQADAELVHYAEKLLSGAIGSVSARIMISSVVKEEPLNIDEVMEMLDATQQVIAYSQQLEEKSEQLEKASTELSEANQRLKKMDELKNEFIATITHELRTPLTSIRAFSEIIHDSQELTDEQRKEFLAIIIKESERLTRMINQILDSEKLASGRMEWHMDNVDLKEILQETLASMGQLIRDKKIEVKIKFDKDSLPIYGDRDRLTQVLMNLLGNAIKFCPEEHGLIRIKLKKMGNQVELRIEDNGFGIKQENRDRIFDKFQQLNPKDGKPAGTGLGLYISKSIIEHHQGSIGLAADSENGAIFCITLTLK